MITRTRLKNKVQSSFISVKVKINKKSLHTCVHITSHSLFTLENEKTWKRESFEYFLVLKKKKKNPYIILYLTIITVRIVARPRYSTNQPLFPFFTRCVSLPYRRSSFHEYEQRITEPYRREWKGYSVKGEEASQAGTRNAHRKRYPIRRPLCTFDVSRAEDGLSWKCIMDSIYF